MRAEDILPLFDFPRPNATGNLDIARDQLDSLLTAAGFEVRRHTFECAAVRMDMVTLAVLAGAALLVTAAWRQRARLLLHVLLAFGVALLAAAGVFDTILPRATQTNLHVLVEPRDRAVQEVLLGAHYDSKTEAFDHVERTWVLVGAAAASAAAGLGIGIGRSRRLVRATAAIAALLLACLGFNWSAGRWLPPSHGMADDAASCALLLELASRAAHQPLLHTRLRFVWWSGEEVGAQGSEAFAQRLDPAAPRVVLNLEAIGAGPDLAVAGREWTGRGLARPNADLVRRIDAAAHGGLRTLAFPVRTDLGPFRARGTPGLTLLNMPAGARVVRGLHRDDDRIDRIEPRGIARTRDALVRFLLAHDG